MASSPGAEPAATPVQKFWGYWARMPSLRDIVSKGFSSWTAVFVMVICFGLLATTYFDAQFQTPSLRWIAGIGLGMLATSTSCVGKIYFRHAHLVDLPERANTPEPMMQTWEWLLDTIGNTRRARRSFAIGFLLLCINPVLNIMAFSLAPQGAVSATAGLTVALNLVLAPAMLGESVNTSDVVGAMLVLLGCFGIAFTLNHDDPELDYTNVMDRFNSARFSVLFCGAGLVWTVLGAGIVQSSRPWLNKLSWGLIGGSVQGFFVFLKCTVMLFHSDPKAWDQGKVHWLLAATVAVAAIGFYLLYTALARYKAIFVAPCYQGALVIMGAVSGVTFFGDLDHASRTQVLLFVVSLWAVKLGTVFCVRDSVSTEAEPGHKILEPAAALEAITSPGKGNGLFGDDV